jgi:gamma-glutamyltranspeptidase/glutathione hydrolase
MAGASVLDAGGTAADAAVAVGSTLSVVYPHMTGIGGDLFALYFDAASGSVYSYDGSGAAGALATHEFFERSGFAAIPERGPAAALTVPGAVDAWFALRERFGSMEMSRLVAPGVALARDGAPVARSVARALIEERELLEADEGARTAYGSGRSESALLVQPALARTLENIGSRGRDWFYAGEGAAAIDRYCARIGSPLRAPDLAAHRGAWVEPIRAGFFGFDSVTTAPPSQGLALLIAQSIYEEFAGACAADDVSASFVHAAVEATRFAYADRDEHVCDPSYRPAPIKRLLARDRIRELGSRIDADRTVDHPPIGAADLGGTTYYACVDVHGNAVSVIQSIYQHFGSCVVVPDLGIALHNRGCWFTLDEGRPRSLAPGRRPFHTLIANMLLREGRPRVVYGSMGGDAQPQTGLSLSIRIGERDMEPQAAIERPRWRWSSGTDPALLIERRAGAACVEGLRARGHSVGVTDDWDEALGHAGAIVIDRDRGIILAGTDPRSDGLALAG